MIGWSTQYVNNSIMLPLNLGP